MINTSWAIFELVLFSIANIHLVGWQLFLGNLLQYADAHSYLIQTLDSALAEAQYNSEWCSAIAT